MGHEGEIGSNQAKLLIITHKGSTLCPHPQSVSTHDQQPAPLNNRLPPGDDPPRYDTLDRKTVGPVPTVVCLFTNGSINSNNQFSSLNHI
jgi:hypothetical protein